MRNAINIRHVSFVDVSPRPGSPIFLRDSATLVRDRGLGVGRVGRVLQDVTHEIERGVKRLVVLRIWRNIGLRAGLLVPFGLQVSAQRSLAARVGACFELLGHLLQHLKVSRSAPVPAPSGMMVCTEPLPNERVPMTVARR